MWTLDEADEAGARLLRHDDPIVAVILRPAEQAAGRHLRGVDEFERQLRSVLTENGHPTPPPFARADLIRVRRQLGGASFDPIGSHAAPAHRASDEPADVRGRSARTTGNR